MYLYSFAWSSVAFIEKMGPNDKAHYEQNNKCYENTSFKYMNEWMH